MKRIIGILVLLAVLVLFAGCAAQTTTQQQTGQQQAQEQQTAQEKAEIIIKDFAFNPKDIAIKAGTEVEWANQDSVIHDVTTEFFDHDINPGESFSYTFAEAGVYEYHCDIHPQMTGTITVE